MAYALTLDEAADELWSCAEFKASASNMVAATLDRLCLGFKSLDSRFLDVNDGTHKMFLQLKHGDVLLPRLEHDYERCMVKRLAVLHGSELGTNVEVSVLMDMFIGENVGLSEYEVLGVLHWEYADRLSLRIVDFAALSFDEQVQIGHSTDLLIGTHGAGLTHMLWMVPGSAVVEISTSYGERKNQHYRNMAGFMRHSYHRVEGLVPLLGSVGTVELSRLRIAMDSALRSLELPKMIN